MVGFRRRLGDPDLLANGGLSDLQFCRCTSETQTPRCPLKSEKGIQESIVRMWRCKFSLAIVQFFIVCRSGEEMRYWRFIRGGG